MQKKSWVKMKFLIIFFILGLFLHDTTAVRHSLKYFYTASSGIPDFPEFVAVGLVDDVQMIYYDSNTERAEPKQDWMRKVTEDDPQYLERSGNKFLSTHQYFKFNIEALKLRFNQTGDVHIFQRMYGCEWDDETNKVNSGYEQYGYDGKDFLILDMNTQTWNAAKPQAVITKQEWDNNRYKRAVDKNYHTSVCPYWLKKYVNYGRSSLMRTVLPSVSFLQKSPSSPVTCHATGFYPDSAVLFWRKDRKKLQEDVKHREIIPNHDGSFQMSVDLLELPSDDWRKYECVFRLAGVKNSQVYGLDKRDIRTNYENPPFMILLITTVVIPLSTVVCVAGFFIHKKRNDTDPVTPNSLPMERPHGSLPQVVYPETDIPVIRRCWRHSESLADHFWSRFISEYLPSLQTRQKWHSSPPELLEGAVVMLVDPQLPQALWPIGHVVKIHRSDDGYIRSADVNIKGHVYSPPVAGLVMLPALPSGEEDTTLSPPPPDID